MIELLIDMLLLFNFSITDGKMEPIDGDLSKSMLENTKCYLLDCGAEIYIWVGRVTQVDERKAASQSAEVKNGNLLKTFLRSLEYLSQSWLLTFYLSSTGIPC